MCHGIELIYFVFEEYYKAADCSLKHFSTFLMGILRQLNVDELKFQNQIEEIVWSMINVDMKKSGI